MEKREKYQPLGLKIIEVRVENGYQESGGIGDQGPANAFVFGHGNNASDNNWIENEYGMGQGIETQELF